MKAFKKGFFSIYRGIKKAFLTDTTQRSEKMAVKWSSFYIIIGCYNGGNQKEKRKETPCKYPASTALLVVFLSPQGMYVFMHAVKGTPFETPDQGKARLLTHWEQLDYGVQFTSSKKFFTISPIVLYVFNPI